jgi:hypothetical protein
MFSGTAGQEGTEIVGGGRFFGGAEDFFLQALWGRPVRRAPSMIRFRDAVARASSG